MIDLTYNFDFVFMLKQSQCVSVSLSEKGLKVR